MRPRRGCRRPPTPSRWRPRPARDCVYALPSSPGPIVRDAVRRMQRADPGRPRREDGDALSGRPPRTRRPPYRGRPGRLDGTAMDRPGRPPPRPLGSARHDSRLRGGEGRPPHVPRRRLHGDPRGTPGRPVRGRGRDDRRRRGEVGPLRRGAAAPARIASPRPLRAPAPVVPPRRLENGGTRGPRTARPGRHRDGRHAPRPGSVGRGRGRGRPRRQGPGHPRRVLRRARALRGEGGRGGRRSSSRSGASARGSAR